MIRAEVDGSELLLLAAGCSAFSVGVAVGIDEVIGLSDAGPSTAPAPLLDFFFFVILSNTFDRAYERYDVFVKRTRVV